MKKVLGFILAVMLVLCLASCENMDPNYGKSSAQKDKATADKVLTEVKIPEIKSDDEVMPNYLDISLYDEENYSDIYLGKKFEYKITYSGSQLELPNTYKKMVKSGWTLKPSEYTESSQILAGKTARVEFVNEYDKHITAIFYNGSKSSQELKKCSLVKFIVFENVLTNLESNYGQFWVNGVSNESAITDVIEYLGSPSHFYKVSENKYYLDWFISENDRRSGITVYVDTAEDRVDSIEVSYY